MKRPPLPSFRGVTAMPGDGSEGHAPLVRIDPHRADSRKRRESAKPEERHPTERRGGRMSGGEERREASSRCYCRSYTYKSLTVVP